MALSGLLTDLGYPGSSLCAAGKDGKRVRDESTLQQASATKPHLPDSDQAAVQRCWEECCPHRPCPARPVPSPERALGLSEPLGSLSGDAEGLGRRRRRQLLRPAKHGLLSPARVHTLSPRHPARRPTCGRWPQPLTQRGVEEDGRGPRWGPGGTAAASTGNVTRHGAGASTHAT